MKIVITGAAGRIGRQMTLELAGDHELVLLDRRTPTAGGWIRADLAQSRPVLRYRHLAGRHSWQMHIKGADAILHLAGNPSPWTSLAHAMKGNVEVTWNLLEAAAWYRVPRVVYASSCWAARRELLEATSRMERIPEPVSPSPATAYGLSKAAAEEAGCMAVASKRLNCFVAVRIGTVVWKPPREVRAPILERGAVGVADLRSILRLCLERPLTGFHRLYGISPVPGSLVDLEATRRLLQWSPIDIPEDPRFERRITQTA